MQKRTAAYDPDEDDRGYAHLLTLLSVSAAMVGVCLTAIGLVSVIEAIRELEVWVDDMLAIGALLFSLVTLLSFFRYSHAGPTRVALRTYLCSTYCSASVSLPW